MSGDPAERRHRAVRRLARMRMARLTRAGDATALRAFHARAKYLLMACDPQRARALGALAAGARNGGGNAFAEYAAVLDAVLAWPPPPGGHENALLHMYGYVSDRLDAAAGRRFRRALAGYRAGTGSLERPVRLLWEWIAAYEVSYLKPQMYFEAYLSR